MDNIEKWAPIPQFEGLYEVSTKARVRSLDRVIVDTNEKRKRLYKGRVMRLQKDKDGYSFVHLHYRGKEFRDFKVHRLVAKVFIPNPDSLPYVNHLDSDRSNNDVCNLEWCSPQRNAIHAREAGRMSNNHVKRGAANKNTRLLLMYVLDGNYIRSFFGAREAAEFLGFKTFVNIYMHLAGKRKNAYGHLWKVADHSPAG